MTASERPARPAPVDMHTHPFLTGVFAPQREEVDVADLSVAARSPTTSPAATCATGPIPGSIRSAPTCTRSTETRWCTASASRTAGCRTPTVSSAPRWWSPKRLPDMRSGRASPTGTPHRRQRSATSWPAPCASCRTSTSSGTAGVCSRWPRPTARTRSPLPTSRPSPRPTATAPCWSVAPRTPRSTRRPGRWCCSTTRSRRRI